MYFSMNPDTMIYYLPAYKNSKLIIKKFWYKIKICNITRRIAMDIDNKIKDIFLNCWRDELDINEIDIDQKFIDIGINSVIFVKLVVNIEKEYGFEFRDEDLNLENFQSLRSIINYVHSRIDE